jgi:TolA-binding protein
MSNKLWNFNRYMPSLPSTRRTRRTRRALGVFSTTALAAMTFMVAPQQATAQEPGGVRYDRTSKKTKAKSNLVDTKFKTAKEAEEKRQNRRVNMMSGTDFNSKHREAVAQEMADKQIEFLKRLIKSTDKSDAEYPDLLFRLADHFLEKKAYFDLQAGELYEAIYAAEDANDASKAKQLKAKQKSFQKKAKESSAQAARVYAALVNDPAFGTYQRMDEALYYYAFELGQLGEEQKMQMAYQQLINNYPESQFISQAYLAFADYYFGKGEIQSAVRLYEKVTEFKDSPVYAYALYKLAWCHLNPIGTAEARYDKSLNYFIETIKATTEGRAGSEANAKQLRRDARRDLVRAYVHASKPSKAWDFFGKWGKGPQADEDDQRKMMGLLANQYFGEGKYVESTFVYKVLQKQYAGDAEVCEWQGRIVVNTLAEDNKDVQWRETSALGAYWTQFKEGDYKKSVKRQCRDNALDTMKQMATVWHDEAEKTRIDDTYELAVKAYEGFLSVFPDDKDAYELQYYYAELLWALATNNYEQKTKDARAKGLDFFRKAHTQFVRTLELDPKGKYTHDAAFAQMLALKNALEYDETGGKKKACKTNSEGICVYDEGKKKKPKKSKEGKTNASTEYPESDYTDDEAQMLASYDTYVKYISDPKDKELPKIMYHRAKLAMIHNKFETARPLLEEMLDKFDGSTYAAWCSEMLLDLLTIQWVDVNNNPEQAIKASEDLEFWSNKMQTLKVWTHPEADEIRDAIPNLLAGIGWKKGMAYRDAGAAYVDGKPGGDSEGFKKCAEQFIQVFNDYEDHDRADTLLWNAADCSDAGYMVGQAIKIRDILLDMFPDSKHAKDTLHFVAESHQAVAHYRDAATRFEEFAEKHKKDKRASNALQNAYLFRLGIGDESKAEENLAKYEAMYKKKDVKKAAKIFWSKNALIETEGGKKTHAEQYLKTYGSRGGADRQAVAEALIGQVLWRRSCEEELLYDSCLSVKRKKTVAGFDAIMKEKKIMERRARLEAKREKQAEKAKGKDKKKYRPPQRCGSATQGLITVHKRSSKGRANAEKRFKTVMKLSKKKVNIPAEDVQRLEAFRNAQGMAMVYLADGKYEDYLQINMPEGLSFNVEEWKKDSGLPKWEKEYKEQVKKKEDSEKRFKKFFEDKVKLLNELTEAYAKVKATGSPYWTLASAARTAMLSQNFADQLYRADVPRDIIKTEDEYYAYCDALADQAQPLQKQAFDAFTYCIERSTEFSFFNQYSRLCEEEMQQWDAEKYPATNEMFGTSIYTRSSISQAQVMRDSSGAHRAVAKRKGDAPAEEEGKEEEKTEE